MESSHLKKFVVLGAGVVGLTTALELKQRIPDAKVVVAAKHFPGDRDANYCSPWAGANWMTTATDNGIQEEWDAETYRRFKDLANGVPEAGITRMDLRAVFDRPIEEAEVLSKGTGKIWYDEITGGLHPIAEDELPQGAHFGMVFSTFMVNTQAYLPWLNTQCLKNGIEFHRAFFDDIHHLFRDIPADGYFNCTGLGSRHLKGVEDSKLYPTRGQVMLVETPKAGIEKMYFRSPRRVDNDTTYIFPRSPTGGVILGGCRVDHDWNGEVDLSFAEDIKRRCCALAPELGKPEDLKVIYHAVGLRPSRVGGSRLELENIDGRLVIHNYGAGGTGYQSSWGMAKYAVDFLAYGREAKM